MSRYGHDEVITKTIERPYPPILEFVPPPPYPSAASSLKGAPKIVRKEGARGCNEKGNLYMDSSDDYSTDGDDKESLPEFPYDEHSSCVRAICPKNQGHSDAEEEMEGEDYDEEETAAEQYQWFTKRSKRRVTHMIDVQTRLSDISIHEEEYQAALSAGKIHLRGKGQKLYEPILGEVAPEADRIGFHFFLKKTGVLSIIARSILALYDEPNKPPPKDAIEYMVNSVGYKLTIRDNLNELKNYKESLLIRYQRLSVENDWLHRALDAYEPTELDSITGRPPNPYNTLEHSTDDFDFEYDNETLDKLQGIFVKKYTPSQEEQELGYNLENSHNMSLEEFDEAMREINPNYLDLTDISSDEDVPGRKGQTSLAAGATSTSSGLVVSVSPSNNISQPIGVSSEPRKTLVGAVVRATQGIKASIVSPKPKRKMTMKSEDAELHKVGQSKVKETKKGKRKNMKEKSTIHINSHSIAENGVNKAASKVDHAGHSLVKLYDPDHEKELNQIIMEEEDDVKKHITWFNYDYEEEGFEDLCGFRKYSVSDISHKPAEEDVEESDGEEQIPLLYDTSEDDTGLENINPEVHGHLDTQTITENLPCDSDDDKEFIKDPDYQEPELSSDEEDFGRKRKVSAIKYMTRRADSSGEEDDSEWQKFVAGDDQLIDVMEMEPIVPYSSDEDELDTDLVEPPCYEFPVSRTLLPTYSHSYRQS